MSETLAPETGTPIPQERWLLEDRLLVILAVLVVRLALPAVAAVLTQVPA